MSFVSDDNLHQSDRALAVRIVDGDEVAFNQFFDENFDRIYRFALTRLGGDEHAAEDLAQQTFTKALDRMANYRGEAQLFTWLCTICRNTITDWYRKHGASREKVVLIEDRPELRAMLESFSAPEQDRPDQHAQRADTVRLIQVVLDQLPSQYGNVLEWRYVEGFSASEVAKRMDIGIEAVNSLTARAKRAFIELYKPLLDELNLAISQETP